VFVSQGRCRDSFLRFGYRLRSSTASRKPQTPTRLKREIKTLSRSRTPRRKSITIGLSTKVNMKSFLNVEAVDRRWIAWARPIVSRHDYSKALKRENVTDKEGN
jgi:hypothetical protein